MGGRLPETTGTAANRKCFVRKHIPRHRPVTGNYRYDIAQLFNKSIEEVFDFKESERK